MTSYDGPATLIANGREADAEVRLREWRDGGLKTWGGNAVIAVADAEVTESREATLRMPDGREATVVIGQSTVGSGSLHAHLELTGSSAPPF